ncbi:M48 family peptidase [uncultured Paludibaculum sp.]|uniref:M48 family peptidase n=1 Tax=uncultured Paludibaculum sp. TaxID=1765020 RepID=UPI002AAB809E|nr:M48 family peptidase [uncultured Paludibaculum sp.]
MQVLADYPTESTEQIFARVYSEIARGKSVRAVVCVIRPYVNTMGKIHLRGDDLEVRISDLISGAPETVREALAWILFSKLFRRPVPPHWLAHYRRYMNRRDVRHTHQVVRQTRGRKYLSGPLGAYHDLDPLFDALNLKYFAGWMQKPLLGWSRKPSRWLLGHFDSAHNAIILSRILDQEKVPAIAVEYVLYHEMLHLKHPVEHRGARRCVHSREFHLEEQRFEGLKEAKAILKQL